ncbi:hypothetical protein DIPPA_28863 [Diplonema papillatum]|nr:hypothetical protein DIPPA_28863 [Diplonema papillatum]
MNDYRAELIRQFRERKHGDAKESRQRLKRTVNSGLIWAGIHAGLNLRTAWMAPSLRTTYSAAMFWGFVQGAAAGALNESVLMAMDSDAHPVSYALSTGVAVAGYQTVLLGSPPWLTTVFGCFTSTVALGAMYGGEAMYVRGMNKHFRQCVANGVPLSSMKLREQQLFLMWKEANKSKASNQATRRKPQVDDYRNEAGQIDFQRYTAAVQAYYMSYIQFKLPDALFTDIEARPEDLPSAKMKQYDSIVDKYRPPP